MNYHSLINDIIDIFNPRPYAFTPSAIIQQEEQFADTSFYQLSPDWDVYRTKARAAIIRCGQNLWIDTEFHRSWREAKRVGLARGTYFFYDDRISPKQQADLVISLIKDDLPEMEVFIDWERSYGGAYSGLKNVVAMMEVIEKDLPTVKIGMYTGYYFFRENSNPITNASQYNYLKSRPLWLAWYAESSKVFIPAPWDKITHWQFGTPSVGLEWGVATKEIDMNYFNGSKAEFEQKYLNGSGETTPPPTTGGTVTTITIYHLTTTTTAKRWSNFGCTNRIYPDLKNGEKLEAILKISGNYELRDGSYVKGNQVHEDYQTTETTGETPPPTTDPDPTPEPTIEYLIGYDATNNPVARFNKA